MNVKRLAEAISRPVLSPETQFGRRLRLRFNHVSRIFLLTKVGDRGLKLLSQGLWRTTGGADWSLHCGARMVWEAVNCRRPDEGRREGRKRAEWYTRGESLHGSGYWTADPISATVFGRLSATWICNKHDA